MTPIELVVHDEDGLERIVDVLGCDEDGFAEVAVWANTRIALTPYEWLAYGNEIDEALDEDRRRRCARTRSF